MSDDSAATVAGAASVAGAAIASPVGASAPVSKEDVIARVKGEIEKLIAEAETAIGHELTDLRADLAAIEVDAETFWQHVEAWFKKHF